MKVLAWTSHSRQSKAMAHVFELKRWDDFNLIDFNLWQQELGRSMDDSILFLTGDMQLE